MQHPGAVGSNASDWAAWFRRNCAMCFRNRYCVSASGVSGTAETQQSLPSLGQQSAPSLILHRWLRFRCLPSAAQAPPSASLCFHRGVLSTAPELMPAASASFELWSRPGLHPSRVPPGRTAPCFLGGANTVKRTTTGAGQRWAEQSCAILGGTCLSLAQLSVVTTAGFGIRFELRSEPPRAGQEMPAAG